jgi:hypothetical protein
MALDFIRSETADSRLTISGGAGGTRVNSSGNIVSASAPRFDYDPVSLAARGLLVEEQRTNLLLQSASFGTTWTVSASTIGSDVAASPDGGTNADKVQEDATAATHVVQQFVSYSNATSYTLTAYLKAGERTWGWLFFPAAAFTALSGSYFDLSAGAVGASIGTGVTATITPAGNGWYRCAITKTSTAAASGNTGIGAASANSTNSYTGTSGSGIYVWGAQLEAGSFATSYIPTTTAQVTRTADSVTMTGSNFSAWFNAAQGALYIEADSYAVPASTFPAALEVGDGTSSNRLTLSSNSSLDHRFSVVSGGATQADANAGGTITVGSVEKWAMAFATNDIAASANGGAVATDASAAIPTVDRLAIGAGTDGNRRWNGHIRRIRDYPTRLPNAQLQVLTN